MISFFGADVREVESLYLKSNITIIPVSHEKKSLKNLTLNKKIVSNLSNSRVDKIKGGTVDGCPGGTFTGCGTTSFDRPCNPNTDIFNGASCDCTGGNQ